MKVTLNLNDERLSNLLCSAFEGGSNYWYMIEVSHRPVNFDRYRTSKEQIYPHIDYPMNTGGYLLISANGDGEQEEINGKKIWKLDLASMKKGTRVFAEKYPRHFADVLDETDDSTTGDVFLQCCLFGEVIYG